MIKYKHEILKLNVAPSLNYFTDVVTQIIWRLQISKGGFFTDRFFATDITPPIDNNEYFIYFDDLSDETVFSWIESHEDMDEIKQELLKELEIAKNPIEIEKNVPWDKTNQYLPSDKFLVVVDNDVVDSNKTLGPISWNSDAANKFIEKRGINYKFPDSGFMFSKGILPTEEPLMINDRLSVYKCQIEHKHIDTQYQTISNVFWDISSGKAVQVFEIEDKSLATIKNDIKADIKKEEATRKVTNITLYETFSDSEGQIIEINTNISTDKLVYMEIIGNLLEIQNDMRFCKINENDIIQVNKEILQKILHMINQHYSDVNQWCLELYKNVDNASTLSELQ